MILNSYAVLDGFLTLVRLFLGLLVVVLAIRSWQAGKAKIVSADDQTRLEDRYYLLILLASVLLVLNVAAWPLFYLLLQSYVPEWPGVMCIYGVTQIGAGSLGISRFLPRLVHALEVTKPLLVFLSGAWLVLHLANRRTATAPLTGKVLLLVATLGGLAFVDSAAEAAYLTIPKKEEMPSVGCCTEAFDSIRGADKFLPGALLDDEGRPWLSGAYYVVNGTMALALLAIAAWPGFLPLRAGLTPLLLGAALSVPVNAFFLMEVAAPVLLREPYHHCPYDLVFLAPESLIGVALYFLGLFSVGWACLVAWAANCKESQAFLRTTVGRVLFLALFGYLGSLLFMVVELELT
jgi:hypothetical protein